MAGFQQMLIIGNVGRDPEFKYMGDGTACCNFSVAVSKSWTDSKSGDKKEKTLWFAVTVWRDRAETVSKYVKKGSRVMVLGQVDIDVYITKSGAPAAALRLTADQVQFLDNKPADPVAAGAAASDGSGLPI